MSIFSEMRIGTLAFICFPSAWNIFFHPLTFSLYVSLGLNWVSCRQHISSVQSFSCVQLFETPWISARQASLSITNSWSLPELMSIESVILSNYLILCRPLLLLPAPQSLTEEIWIRLGGCINVIFPVAIYMIVMQDISFRENWSVLRFLCTVSYNCAWS